MLWFSQNQSIENTKQSVELAWQQGQPISSFFKSFSKYSKFKTTGWIEISTGWFSTFFRKHFFLKRTWTKQHWIITLTGLTNSNYIRHIHNQQQGLQAIHLDLETSKPVFNNLPLFDKDKSLVCLCCPFRIWKHLQNRNCACTR